MNCDWREEDAGGGLRVVWCTRTGCGTRSKPTTYTRDKIHCLCRGLPHPHEWREWLRLFADALGYSQAKAICAYIRWRAKGSLLDALPPGIPQPVLPAIEEGPGTELHKLIAELGITPTASCGCEAMRQRMNAWRAEGCKSHREEILSHLQTAYQATDLEAVFLAALRGATHPWLIRRINPLHPIESGLAALFDEALRRAQQAAE